MTNKIMALLNNAGLVNSDNDQIVLLGVRRICGALTDLLVAMIWSLILGDVLVGILFEASYSLLRIYAGGYHASSERVCKILTYTSTLLSILVVFVVNVNSIWLHCLLAICLCLVIFFAPIEHENKPLTKMEKEVYRRYCILIAAIETGVYVFFVLVNAITYAKTVYVAVLLVAIGVIFEKKRKYR